MINTQKILLTIYLPFTFLIILYDNIFPQENMVYYLKYFIIGTLMLSALISKQEYPEHHEKKWMALSLVFVFIGDFFLVFLNTIYSIDHNLDKLGVVGFMFAYICLIKAYKTKSKNKSKDLKIAIPVVIAFTFTIVIIKPYLEGFIFLPTLAFTAVIYYMMWNAICTLNRGYYSKKTSWLITISSILMVVCDTGVALSNIYPKYSVTYIPLLKNIIWGSYIPAWTLIVVIINEKNLYKEII